MNATPSAINIQGFNFSDLFFGAIKKPIFAWLENKAWYHWEHWNIVMYFSIGLIVFVILFWFYVNFIR